MMTLPLAVSQTITKGTALVWASGYLSIGTTTSTDVRFVAMEDVTTDGSSHTEILVLPVEGVEFEVGTDDVVSIVDRGTYADLATGATINPDLSTYDAFYISEYVGEAEVSKTVRGHFVHALE
jgi:hypothetical protein